MSALQKSILKNKLPPLCPRTSGISKYVILQTEELISKKHGLKYVSPVNERLAPFGAARRKDYSPVSWRQYFAKSVDVETEGGMFRVYLSPEPDHAERPRIVTLHGGGYSGLSWALFTTEITNMIHCQVVSMDIRGHGETKVKDPEDLSGDTLAKDVEQVLHKLYGSELPPLILVGHSMGGAVAVRVAHLASLEHAVQGTAVIDVVEGTAMDALASMQSFLRSRPTHFNSIEHAIEWCVRSGQVRNLESAKVSMPSQIVNCATDQLAINEIPEEPSPLSPEAAAPPPPARGSRAPPTDLIEEEGAEEEGGGGGGGDQFVPPAAPDDSSMKYKWRIDLSKTERHWSGWFSGLSQAFLSQRAPRLLLLASIDGLDRELTVGQMQGKFQMQVLTRCGHAVHEDSPAEVARVVASFALRHRLTAATENGEHMHLVSAPGC